MKKKKVFIIVISVLVAVVAINIGLGIYFNTPKNFDMTKMEYRTDAEPIVSRFGEVIEIESCFWKADVFGKSRLGPSEYWMKGFIMLSEKSFETIKSQYELSEVDLKFEEGMESSVTGFEEFQWCHNRELTESIVGAEFMGDFYIDVKNGILYFDLETY